MTCFLLVIFFLPLELIEKSKSKLLDFKNQFHQIFTRKHTAPFQSQNIFKSL
jgi:hypothetical protein